MFSITFTKAQAEQFIHGIFQKNFRDNPEFTVKISDEESDMEIKGWFKELNSGSALKVDTKDEAELISWLVPDADGWFTHDPDWKSSQCPPYITQGRIAVILRDESPGEHFVYAKNWNWFVDNDSSDIIKWKYAE